MCVREKLTEAAKTIIYICAVLFIMFSTQMIHPLPHNGCFLLFLTSNKHTTNPCRHKKKSCKVLTQAVRNVKDIYLLVN